jgi:hypothetical protein
MEESGSELPLAARWGAEEDLCEGPTFRDTARVADLDEIADILNYVTEGSEELSNVLATMIEDNEGRILYIARQDETDAFAVSFLEGAYFIAEMEMEEPLLDEGLVSISLIAANGPAPEAPLVPGFAPIEQKLWEVLHASEVLRSTLQEAEGSEALRTALDEFASSLVSVLVEVASDADTLSEKELNFIYETFAGAFAGLHEESVKFLV